MQTNLKQQLLHHNRADALNLSEAELQARVESTIAKTFGRVGVTLLLAFGTAYSLSLGLLPIPVSPTMFWVSWIGGLGLILWMSFRWQTMSYTTLSILLLAFGLLEGYGLTGVFLAYEMGSIYQVFLTTSFLFLGLAIAGYYLHIDIAKVGPVLLVSLIALIIAMVVNMFWANAQFDIWLSVIGLIIFAGFIIYDMNVLKQASLHGDNRIEILMALGLFINFINIFLFLLRLMGGSE